MKNLVFLALVTMFGCGIAPEIEDARRGGHPWDGHKDQPSRVIYEATGRLVVPYKLTGYDPVRNIYADVGCIHMATGTIRGHHFGVWAETIPHQSVDPFTGNVNARAPYGPTDVLYWPWYETNPFE